MTLALLSPDQALKFYTQRVLRGPGPVLVLGSGDGSLSLALAARGLEVVGVEWSPVLAEVAMAEARSRLPGLPPERLRLVTADVRTVRLTERFEQVLAPRNGLGQMATLDDVDAFLATAKRHLAPQGTFLFDVRVPGPSFRPTRRELAPGDLPSDVGGAPERFAEPSEVAGPGGAETELEEDDLDESRAWRDLAVPHLRERRREPGEPLRREGIRRLRLRSFSPSQLDRALARAGFTATERYGSFEGKPFLPGDSLQVVVAAPADEPTDPV